MKAEAYNIENIVQKVIEEINNRNNTSNNQKGVFNDMNDAIEAAWLAQKKAC